MLADFILNLLAGLRIILEILFCVLTPLTNLAALIRIPCTTLYNDADRRSQIEDITPVGDSLEKNNIKLCLL